MKGIALIEEPPLQMQAKEGEVVLFFTGVAASHMGLDYTLGEVGQVVRGRKRSSGFYDLGNDGQMKHVGISRGLKIRGNESCVPACQLFRPFPCRIIRFHNAGQLTP